MRRWVFSINVNGRVYAQHIEVHARNWFNAKKNMYSILIAKGIEATAKITYTYYITRCYNRFAYANALKIYIDASA